MAECGKGNCPARLSRNDRFSSERGERVTDGRDAGCRPSRSVSTMGRRTLSRGHGDGRARVTWNARGSLPLSGAARSDAGRDDAHSGNAAQSPATGERTADNKRGSGIARLRVTRGVYCKDRRVLQTVERRLFFRTIKRWHVGKRYSVTVVAVLPGGTNEKCKKRVGRTKSVKKKTTSPLPGCTWRRNRRAAA